MSTLFDLLPPSSLALAFTAGVMGSAHCVGMCGAFVVSVGRCVPHASLRGQLLYATGRVLAYGLLGAVYGLVGSFVLLASRLADLQGWVMLAAGVAVLGFASSRWVRGDAVVPASSPVLRWLARGRSMIPPDGGGTVGLLLLGALNALIPCGLLYTMQLRAATTGDAVAGMVLMVVFGVGTVPALVALGHFGQKMTPRRRVILDRLVTVVLLGMGIQILLRAAAHLGWIAHTSWY